MTAAMGFEAECISVEDCPQAREGQCQCRCPEQASTTRISHGSDIAGSHSHAAGDSSVISSECQADC